MDREAQSDITLESIVFGGVASCSCRRTINTAPGERVHDCLCGCTYVVKVGIIKENVDEVYSRIQVWMIANNRNKVN